MRTHIYLKGGAVIDLDFDKFTTTGTGDGLSKASWETPKAAKLRLHHLNLGEVAAITFEVEDE